MGLRDWFSKLWGEKAAPAEAALTPARKDAPADPSAAFEKLSLEEGLSRALEALEHAEDEVVAASVLGWLRRKAQQPALPASVRLRLSDFFSARGEQEQAESVLQPLLRSGDADALPALVRMADLAELRGDREARVRYLEELLAIDVAWPGVRERWERLRAPVRTGGAGATLLSPEAAGLAQGRLSLVRELGRGGAGAVFLAHDARLDRDVSVKIYHPGKKQDRLARLRIEAQVAASCASRHVVCVYDLLEELGAVTMEYCAEGSLRQALARKEGDAQQRAAWALGVASALALAHEKGWVHRDLKPGNVLLRAGGDAVLTDFGLARRQGESVEALEGTAGYLAPEARAGGAAATQHDVYAFGALLRELATPSTPALSVLAERCLGLDPAQRPKDGAALCAALRA